MKCVSTATLHAQPNEKTSTHWRASGSSWNAELNDFIAGEGINAARRQELLGHPRTADDLEKNWNVRRRHRCIVDSEQSGLEESDIQVDIDISCPDACNTRGGNIGEG